MNDKIEQINKRRNKRMSISLSERQEKEINDIYKIQKYKNNKTRMSHILNMLLYMGIELYQNDPKYKWYISEIERQEREGDAGIDKRLFDIEVRKKIKEEIKRQSEIETNEVSEPETVQTETEKIIIHVENNGEKLIKEILKEL